jgi:hypothetical protein
MESMKKLKHFKKLLKKDGVGRINNYEFDGRSGRAIIVSERIDYQKKLKLNTLILDGTAGMTKPQYKGYTGKLINNYNDYYRLNLIRCVASTSKYSRSKKGHTTQKAIHKHIKNKRKDHHDLFVLPMKSDINIYKKLGSIHENHIDLRKIIHMMKQSQLICLTRLVRII